jgi:tetratricopeptide (TPR) repeat protein
MRRQKKPIDREERRENAMRPSKYLGYNWDELGLYFINREAYGLAEAQFRRAVWLNPFEPEFKLHLAGCLFREGNLDEAHRWIDQVIEAAPDRSDAQHLLELISRRLETLTLNRLAQASDEKKEN